MPEWKVKEFKVIQARRSKKKYIKIREVTTDFEIDGYFPLSMSDTAIKNKFAEWVKEHRLHVAKKAAIVPDFSNFETLL